MNQNQASGMGDRMPSIPQYHAMHSQTNQTHSSYSTMPHNMPQDQPAQGHQGNGQMSNAASASQSTVSMPPGMSSQGPRSNIMVPQFHQPYQQPWAGHMGYGNPMGFPNYGTPENYSGSGGQNEGNQRAQMYHGSTFPQQQSVHMMANMPTSHPNQLPAEHITPIDPALLNAPPAPMNPTPPTQPETRHGRNVMLPSAAESSEEAMEDTTGVATKPEASGSRSKNSTTPRNKNYPLPRGRPKGKHSSHRGVGGSKRDAEELVFKWRPGMKMKPITPDMSEEEREATEEWNIKYSAAKAEHTRKQNRESAQRSRARKISELHNTKDRVEQLETLNEFLNQKNHHLDVHVRELSDEKMGYLQTIAHLSSQNEGLRERVSILERQVQTQTIQNPGATIPMFADQSNTPVQSPSNLQDGNSMAGQTGASAASPQQGAGDHMMSGAIIGDSFQDFINISADDPILNSVENMEHNLEDDPLGLMQLSGGSLSPTAANKSQGWTSPSAKQHKV
ncbi:hypothetical protein F5Y04DRAFT_280341 [Hypomontagnella monticulosa]|nr:hypothetical protein F5Y04DRAFT_280341 [Hypomontagnella monticulosa]